MKTKSMRTRIGRRIYFILASCFTLCILIQIYLAGMAVFLHPTNWTKHTIFGHLFLSMFPILMLVFAVMGSFPRWAYWHIFGLFGSTFLMYFTANISYIFPWISPMHPVFAFLFLILSGSSAQKTWKLIHRDQQAYKKNGDYPK